MNKTDVIVLVVDDEEDIRKSLAINLKLEGFKVMQAGGGFEAIEIIKSNKIDFVISDVRMPEGDGCSLVEKIQTLNPKLPHIVLISGFAEVSKDDVIKKGGIDLFNKPPNIDLLIELICKYCNC